MNAGILERQDSLREPFVGSLLLHLGLAGLAVLAAFLREEPFDIGTPGASGGGSTVVTTVASINMPSQTQRVQPLANPSESIIPQRVEPARPPRPDPDATPIGRKKDQPKKTDRYLTDYLAARQKALNRPLDPSNIGSSAGARASAPMFTQQPGSGEVGAPSGLLGDGFGAYEQYLRTCIARNWKTADVEMSVRTAPDVIVQFQLPRDGRAASLRVVQTSGNSRLDNSGLRAVESCNPFNPLPAGFPKSSANIEIVFRLQR
jgi:TonB family protein